MLEISQALNNVILQSVINQIPVKLFMKSPDLLPIALQFGTADAGILKLERQFRGQLNLS